MAVIQQQPDDQWVRLHWPDSTVIDARRSVICYDHDSDTLFVHFHGRGRPAVSLLVGDYVYLLVDSRTDEVVGLQVEDVLTEAIDEHPILLDALSVAELRGISPTEIDLLRRQRAPSRLLKKSARPQPVV